MDSEPRRLRGWKEIASHLKVSERTVKRWEQQRRLPVHRVSGGLRDVVFAIPAELDAWGQCGGQVVPTPESLPPAAEVVPQPDTPVMPEGGRRWSTQKARRGVLVLGAVLVLLLGGLAAYGVLRGGSAASPASASLSRLNATTGSDGQPRPEILLKITASGGVVSRLRVPDGGCGALAFSGQSPIDVCPRLSGDELLLDIIDRRGAGGPGTSAPFTLRMDANTQVRVVRPAEFDVEWIQASPRVASPRER